MAQQTFPGGFHVPDLRVNGSALTYMGGGYLWATFYQKIAFVFVVPKTGTLDKAELMANYVSSPSAVKLSFQDVDATTGNPDGSVDQYRVITTPTVDWQVPGLMTHNGTDGGTKRSVTKGQTLALVTEWDSTQSGEVDWCGMSNGSNPSMYGSGNTYFVRWDGATWTKGPWGVYLSMALKYDDGTYECPDVMFPLSAITGRTFNNGSTPDERALIFSFPVPVTVDGCWLNLLSTVSCDVILYDSDGTTPLATVSPDKDIVFQASFAPPLFLRFPDVALLANTNYRLAVKPTSGTNVTIYDQTVPSAAIMGAFSPGASWHSSTRTDAGSWTETTTIRPIMGLRISGLADDAGAGPSSSETAVPFVG